MRLSDAEPRRAPPKPPASDEEEEPRGPVCSHPFARGCERLARHCDAPARDETRASDLSIKQTPPPRDERPSRLGASETAAQDKREESDPPAASRLLSPASAIGSAPNARQKRPIAPATSSRGSSTPSSTNPASRNSSTSGFARERLTMPPKPSAAPPPGRRTTPGSPRAASSGAS